MRYSLIALLVAACGGMDRDIEDQITIEQGVYGLLVAGQNQPAANEIVIVFVAGETGIHARATSTTAGIYQIDLPAGDYTLCIENCTVITVPDHDRVRYDWTSGPGGGSWSN